MIGNLEQKKLGLERLEKLSAHLAGGNLGHEKFNFNQYHCGPDPRVTRCGTEGCALGECPFVFPDDWDFLYDDHDLFPRLKKAEKSFGWNYGVSINDDAQEFFFLEGPEVSYLFMPFCVSSRLDDVATPAQVAENIRDFIQTIRDLLDNNVTPATSNSL